MASIGKRIASMLVAGSLALVGLAGCGAQQAAAPTTAAELLAQYEANANKDNFHLDLDLAIDMDVLGQELSMPAEGSYDVADQAMHGIMTMDLSALGSDDQRIEIYTEEEGDATTQYMTDGSGTWYASTLESSLFTERLTSTDLLSDAEFEAVSGDDTAAYRLTIPGATLMEALSSSGVDADSLLSGLGDEVTDALADTEAVYYFDKDCLLTGIHMDFDYNYDTSDDSSLTLSLSMGIDCELGSYGKIDAAAVAVPSEVKEGAVSADDALSLVDDVAEEAAEAGADALSADDATSAEASSEISAEATSATSAEAA